MPSSVLLRSQIESQLANRIPAALSPQMKHPLHVLPTGIPALDQVIALGLPGGALTEISGPASSGRTTLLVSVLGSSTQAGKCCVLVDVADAFHPSLAAQAGVVLTRLLWIRCSRSRDAYEGMAKALQVTDLLIQSGGFGVIAIDLGDESHLMARRIPMTTWYRFRRGVENTQTALVIVDQETITGTCASLTLRMSREERDRPRSPVTHASLLEGSSIHIEAALQCRPVHSVSFQSGNIYAQ